MLNEQVIKETEARFEKSQGALEGVSFSPVGASNLLGENSPEEIARRMQRLGVRPETLPTGERGISFGVIGTEAGSVPDEGVLERILGQNDLLRVGFLEGGVSVARSVGRINIRNASGRTLGFGTGFMVSPRLVMTNNHVLASQTDASTSQVGFNFQDDVTGKPLPTVSFDLKPDEFFVTDRALDYTLVAVRPRSRDGRELADFGWQKLADDEGGVLRGELVNIIQHPGGQPKMLALRENQIVDLLEQFLHYRTDTEPGSSGSPVYNDQWQIVALHHSGVPRRDAQGRILARDGTVWRSEMGENRIDWIANEGVRIGRVLQHLKQQNLGPSQRPLREEIFESAPVVDRSRPNRPQEPGSPVVPGTNRPEGTVQGPQANGMAQQADGSVTWTIPLQVSIRLGTPMMAGNSSTTGVITSPQPVVTSPSPVGPPEEPELQRALAELEEARRSPYYDAAADRRDRDAYYTGLPGSLTPANFYDRLKDLLKSTHTTRPSYKPSAHVYPFVDLQPNLKLKSVYSGKEFTPEEFIREDFRVERERATRLRELFQSESSVGPERLQQEVDLLEAQSPFNCEHVVPQSWFGKREPMRGDLHHLFACESGCNSFRGNIPYFDFADFEEAVRTDCGKREENRFEPVAGKGAVARATLYFLIRYPGEINAVAKEPEEERLRILLRWHEDHEVTEYERHRNQAIFAKQGNRNPLIDFPEWVGKIDFRRGLG